MQIQKHLKVDQSSRIGLLGIYQRCTLDDGYNLSVLVVGDLQETIVSSVVEANILEGKCRMRFLL